MYEQFRTELAGALFDIPGLDVDQILRAVDGVAGNYEISRKDAQLIPYQDELPDTAKMYLIVRKMQGFSDKTLDSYKLLLTNFLRQLASYLGRSHLQISGCGCTAIRISATYP